MKQEYFTFLTTTIAGLSHHVRVRSALDHLQPGDVLTLAREPQNRYDAKAVRIDDVHGMKLGYVPATQSPAVSALIDNGYAVRCVVDQLGRDLMVAVALELPILE
jgi:hypothetical protein